MDKRRPPRQDVEVRFHETARHGRLVEEKRQALWSAAAVAAPDGIRGRFHVRLHVSSADDRIPGRSSANGDAARSNRAPSPFLPRGRAVVGEECCVRRVRRFRRPRRLVADAA